MFCLSQSIAQSDPYLQKLVEKIKNAPSLARLILAALQLGRVVAVKVVEDIWKPQTVHVNSCSNSLAVYPDSPKDFMVRLP